jgi:hypothetical protein
LTNQGTGSPQNASGAVAVWSQHGARYTASPLWAHAAARLNAVSSPQDNVQWGNFVNDYHFLLNNSELAAARFGFSSSHQIDNTRALGFAYWTRSGGGVAWHAYSMSAQGSFANWITLDNNFLRAEVWTQLFAVTPSMLII